MIQQEVNSLIREQTLRAMQRTPLASVSADYEPYICSGKMLRGRLVFRIGESCQLQREKLAVCAAAVEMIHAASLLHDDVIDGGELRRGAPAYWVDKGPQGAILLGDMLLVSAIQSIVDLNDHGLTKELITLTGLVCMAEVEQELILRGQPVGWKKCCDLARRKTGSLFSFAALSGAPDDPRRSALKEAGFLLGTAYQLADDILDASGDPGESDKSLGRDEARMKQTAAHAAAQEGVDLVEAVREYTLQSVSALQSYPSLQRSWQAYLEHDIMPVLSQYLGIKSIK